MNCLLHQYNIMTPIFWLNLILLVMLHLEINTQRIHLFDPLGWKSSCPGTGLIANVDRLFLFGTGTNLSSSKSPSAPYMKFHRRSHGTVLWRLVCRIYLDTCTDDNNTMCGCEQRGKDRYDFHLNVTVTLGMRQASYRLTWINSQNGKIRSEIRKNPRVWNTDYDFVNTVNETHALNSGNCELPFQPNTPFSYCINAIEKPYLIQIVSWNISPSKIASSVRISQHCVNTSGFSESGGILAYTELTGCQRQKSRYCSLKVAAEESTHANNEGEKPAAEESPNPCNEEEKQKGSVNLTVKNQRLDLSQEFCTFTLREDVNVSMTVCVLKKQAPYNVTIVLGDSVMELTNFSQDCVSLYHTPSAATFQPNYQFIFIDRCQKNVTLICNAVLFPKELPGREDDNGGTLSLAIVILSIIIIALLSVMCLEVASLLFISEKWQETEDAVVENDEGDASELKYFDDVEYETTEVSELGYSFTGSQVDSFTTQSTVNINSLRH